MTLILLQIAALIVASAIFLAVVVWGLDVILGRRVHIPKPTKEGMRYQLTRRRK